MRSSYGIFFAQGTQDEAHQLVRRWVVPFLERYLAGDATTDPFLRAPVPPGMTLDAQP